MQQTQIQNKHKYNQQTQKSQTQIQTNTNTNSYIFLFSFLFLSFFTTQKKKKQDKKELLALLSDPTKGTPEDKLRLFIVYFLCNEKLNDLDLFEDALKKGGVEDLSAIKYVRK